MSRRPRMRPTFQLRLGPDGADVLERLRASLAANDTRLVGQVITGHAMIKLHRDHRSLLSPVLNLELAEHDGATFLRGRFSPQPNVWTGFMALYGVLSLVGVAGLMYGFAQMIVDQTPWPMLAAPVCAILIAFVYGAAFIGQGLTVADMWEMRRFVDELVAGTRT